MVEIIKMIFFKKSNADFILKKLNQYLKFKTHTFKNNIDKILIFNLR